MMYPDDYVAGLIFQDFKRRLVQANFERAVQALEEMKSFHSGQTRKDGQPFYVHPLSVAIRVADATRFTNETAIIAATFHDVFEDGMKDGRKVEPGDIQNYGEEVIEAVCCLTFTYELESTDADYRQLQKAVTKSICYANMIKSPLAVLIKLYDRIDNTSTIGSLPPQNRSNNYHDTHDNLLPMVRNLLRANKKNPYHYEIRVAATSLADLNTALAYADGVLLD